MARPTKKEELEILIRNKEILKMEKKGYPRNLISTMFRLSEGQVSKIINNSGRQTMGRIVKKRSVRPIKK